MCPCAVLQELKPCMTPWSHKWPCTACTNIHVPCCVSPIQFLHKSFMTSGSMRISAAHTAVQSRHIYLQKLLSQHRCAHAWCVALQDCLKLGLAINGDFSKLSASWPAVSAFTAAGPVLDLQDMWAAHLRVSNPGVGRLKQAVGLSALCQSLHGKPLDKSMQVGTWLIVSLLPLLVSLAFCTLYDTIRRFLMYCAVLYCCCASLVICAAQLYQ